MLEQVETLVKYSRAMRYIQSGSGIESYLPYKILCLYFWGSPPLRNFCYSIPLSQEELQAIAGGVGTVAFLVVDRLHVASNKEAGVQVKPKTVVRKGK
jgi:hypothetical protein